MCLPRLHMHKPFFWEPHLEVTQQAVQLGEGNFILSAHGDSEGFIPLAQKQSCAFPAEGTKSSAGLLQCPQQVPGPGCNPSLQNTKVSPG